MSEDELINRIEKLERRLEKIETQLGTTRDSTPTISPEPAPRIVVKQIEQQPKQNKAETSGNWLGIVSIICFVLAAGFIVKLSIDSGWLTPLRQIAAAIIFGSALIFSGFRISKVDREYASLLPAAGIIVYFISVFSAYSLYSLISISLAITSMIGISIYCMYIYTRMRHDIYPIISACGAYLAPIVLNLSTNSQFTLLYFVICSASFGCISIWLQSRTLTLLSSYLSIGLTSFLGISLHQDVYIVIALSLHFFIFCSAVYGYSLRHRLALTEKEAWKFFPVLIIFYISISYYMESAYPGLAPWISLVFSAALIAFYLSARRFFDQSLGSRLLIVSFCTIVFFHSGYFILIPDEYKPWLLVISFVCISFSSRISPVISTLSIVPKIAIFLIISIEYVRMVSAAVENSEPLLLVSCISVVSIWLAVIRLRIRSVEKNVNDFFLYLAMAHVLAVASLYRLTLDMGSLAVSISWLCYAVTVIFIGFRYKDPTVVKSALFVLTIAAGKALVVDASSAPTLVRIACLIVTGLVLYGCGILMKRVNGMNVSEHSRAEDT